MQIKNLAAVFIPTSSGTTAQGLHEAFKKADKNPQIHIIQTMSCHPIVKALPTKYKEERKDEVVEKSLAKAIVDLVGFRREAIAEAIKSSRGFGWVANNKDIEEAIELIKKTEKIVPSPNSALSLVGITKALNRGLKFDGPIACILTGR